MAKSSQAARNSRLSAARSSSSRRRQAGSILKNVNLAKVRSAIWVKIAVGGLLLGVWMGLGQGVPLNFFGEAEGAVRGSPGEKVQDAPPPARGPSQSPNAPGEAHATQVTLVLLPQGRSVSGLAAAGLSPGLLSAGLGSVPPEQTYLDITQGNRVFDSLYDTQLPALGRD